ncbi:MAG: nitrophenyl compound nitroreductase subunit ArsF family protein [Candidatus Orphnella occulta]|nr:nitrophenyl compound nitroreductase subunit ArsF family protein [Candidatus Orphnella occulta]
MALIKRTISVFAICFFALSIFLAVPGVASENKVIAYYFHGNSRCPTCHKLEEYSKDAIDTNFKDEIAKGVLEFQVINVDEKRNEHFVDKYQLYTKSLVVSKMKNGEEVDHKNLDKIWEYVRDKERFYDYVTSEIKAFLKDMGNA